MTDTAPCEGVVSADYSSFMNASLSERAALADALQVAGPAAPTLCVGWTARELAAHVVVRESQPRALPGLMLPRWEATTARLTAELAASVASPDLVERIRTGPPRWMPTSVAKVDAAVNLTEFFVHTEDVRRAAHPPLPARELSPATQTALARRLSQASRLLFRKVSGAVTLNPTGHEPIQVHRGQPHVYLTGLPSELTLYSFGRTTVADVTVVGTRAAIAEVNAALGV